ncbi:MAG: gliding motility-associated C-terminal domain-containing protein, partial [Cyclobacteriaceae bacterium]
ADNTATVIVDGQVAAIDFGSAVQGNNVVQTFAIENTGSSSLDISSINVSGTDFIVNNALTSIAAGVTSTFTVTLQGSTAGSFNATVTIANNDADEGSFDFPITGMITSPACTTLTIVNAGSDQSPCAGTAVSLSGAIGGGSASSATWSSSGTGSFDNPNLLNATYTPSTADETNGTITLTLTVAASGFCPQVLDDLVITILPPITAGSATVQSNINQATQVDVIGASTVNAGDVITVTILQNPTKGSVTINTDNSIDYTATNGTIGADSFDYEICNQCGLCSIGSVSIDILNQPPVFTAPATPPPILPGQVITILITDYLTDPNNNIDLASLINLTATGNGIVSYDGNGIITLDYTNATFSGSSESISFRIFDSSLSFVDVTISIDVIGEILTFNGISPNGDGMNDFFEIQNIQFLEPNNKVTIYNRWGDKVFEMDNYNPELPERRFEGRRNSGKELPSGVYFYKVEFSTSRPGLNGYLTLKH